MSILLMTATELSNLHAIFQDIEDLFAALTPVSLIVTFCIMFGKGHRRK